MSSFEGQVRLERIFREVFDDSEFEFSMALSREDLPTWDSLGHIRLISTVEEEFGIQFSIEEIESLTSVSRLVCLLDDRAVK